MGFRLLGRSLVVPKAADFSSILEVPASLIEDYLFDRPTDEEMSRKLEAMYDQTQHFLSVVKADTFLDRSIVNAGDAYWARDPMGGFLQSWKAVEAIADMTSSLPERSMKRPWSRECLVISSQRNWSASK